MLNTHILYEHFLFISCKLVGFTNNSTSQWIKATGMFQTQCLQNPRIKPQLRKTPAGKLPLWEPQTRVHSSILLMASQALLLKQLGIRSRTKTQPILADNHQSAVVIFSKKWKGGVEGCRGYPARYPSPTMMPQAQRCVRVIETRCVLTRREDEALVVHDKWSHPHVSLSFLCWSCCVSLMVTGSPRLVWTDAVGAWITQPW